MKHYRTIVSLVNLTVALWGHSFCPTIWCIQGIELSTPVPEVIDY